MRRLSLPLVVALWGMSIPPAQGCHIVYHKNPARDFIRDSRLDPPFPQVIFTGEVISVNDYRNADGDIVKDTIVRPKRWWMGTLESPVVVRSITPTTPLPCGPPPPLAAKVAEQWLIFGWAHDGWIEPYTDARVTAPLENGKVAAAIAKDLRRIDRDSPKK